MATNMWLQSSCCRIMRVSPFSVPISNFKSSVAHLPTKPSKKFSPLQASSENGRQITPPTSKAKNPLTVVLNLLRIALWRSLEPLHEFGFGRRSVWEASVGLFMVSGAVILALSLVWLRGFHLKSRRRKYRAVFEFSQASGICLGTPVRIRGANVGNVIRVHASLKGVDAVVEIEDDKTIIPLNSLVEVNQSGLLMEPHIDITPQNPLPTPSAGPLDPECAKEGLIICDTERLRGQQGVSLDTLVGIFTHVGQEMEKLGVSRSYRLAEKVASVMQEAQPLLAKQIEAMVEDMHPLLSEVRNSALLKDIESLTKRLTEATENLRRVHSSVLIPENTELIQQSICTLISTLKNIESISTSISGFTGDEATRRHIKQLIRSLSRLL